MTTEKEKMERERLLREIQNFSLNEEGGSARFAKKLARENGWSQKYAERVVKEYKRFLFLAAASGEEVLPSEEVDQAWHLHLVHTKSYWDDLCGKALGKALHHNPSKDGKSETGGDSSGDGSSSKGCSNGYGSD